MFMSMQRHAHRFHAVEVGALRQVLVGVPAILQIGKLGGRQRQLLGEGDRLRADRLGHLAEARFDRHAGFDADQQQVERVGKRAPDRKLAARDLVLHEQAGQVHAEIRGGEAHPDLDHRRLADVEDDEKIEQRDHQHGHRHDHAEEQIGDVGRLAAIPGLHEELARLLLSHPLVEVELVDDGLHVLLGRAAQGDLVAAAGQPFALALADFFPFERDRFHALAQRIGGDERHRQGEHGCNRSNGGEHHCQEARIAQLFDH
jgi:hypothetical protein